MERGGDLDNDVFRLAVIDHAKCLGMDPQEDAQFLWLAEEALLAELPQEWEVYDDNGSQYFYNHRTGQSQWENPLDEPYRNLFQKLKKNPNALANQERRSRSSQWGNFPGEDLIRARAVDALREKKKRVIEEKELSIHEDRVNPPDPPSLDRANRGISAIKNVGDIESILDHRTVTLADSKETDMQYLVKRKNVNEPNESDWISATLLFQEIPKLVHDYNNQILQRATETYNKKMGDMQSDFDTRLNKSKAEYHEECNKLREQLVKMTEEHESKETSWLDQKALLEQQCKDRDQQLESLGKTRSKEAGKSVATRMGLENRLRAIVEENEGLKAKLEHLQEETKSETAKLKEASALEQELLEWKEKVEALRRDKERVTGDRAVLESMLENVKRELDTELASNLECRQKIFQLESEVEQKCRELQKSAEQLENISRKENRETDTLRLERDTLEQELSFARAQLEQTMKNTSESTVSQVLLKEAQESFEKQVLKMEASHAEQVSQLEATLARSKTCASDLEDKISGLGSELISVREELGSTERKLNRSDNERVVLKTSLEKIKSELSVEFEANELLRQELHASKEELESRERQMKADQVTSAKELQNLERENDSLKQKLAQLESEPKTDVALLEAKEEQYNKLLESSEQVKLELEAKIAELNKANAKLETDSQTQFGKLKTLLQQKEEEILSIGTKILEQEQENDSISRLKERATNERTILEQSLASLKEELKNEMEVNDKLRKGEAELKTQVGNLTRDVAQKSTELSEVKQQILEAEKKMESTVQTQKCETEAKLRTLSLDLEKKTAECSSLQQVVNTLENDLKQCKQEMDKAIGAFESKTLALKDEQISKLTLQVEALEAREPENVDPSGEILELRSQIDQMKERERLNLLEADNVESLKTQVRQLKIRCSTEIQKRRKLHNKVVELQGNIRVYCRVRPILQHEIESKHAEMAVEFPNDGEIELVQNSVTKDSNDVFEFDQVFAPNTSQEQVYEQVEPLTLCALDGYNVCIFAYGQTGSGKTYTMDGSFDQRGVNYRTFSSLFQGIEQRMKDSGSVKYKLSLSVLEIYNETIRDLLDESSAGKNKKVGLASKKKLEVRQGEYGLYVPGLTQEEVASVEHVEELMSRGIKNRTVGTHNINQHSSRSHLVVTVHIVADYKKKDKKFTTRSKLHLIDLAGSERLDKTNASGSMLQEAKSINKSLSALGNVIKALGTAEKSNHVPFRDSKLTYLLQDSLSGNSKVLMFVNVSPVEWNAPETLCSLTFAARCRKVALGQAKKNVDSGTVAALKRTIDDLQTKLQRK